MISLTLAAHGGWFEATGVTGKCLSFVTQQIPARERYYVQSQNKWIIRDEHLLTVARLGFLQDGNLHYEGLPIKIRTILQQVQETWKKEDAKYTNAFRPTPVTPPVSVASAYVTLHLQPDAPFDIVEATWRYLARKHHPDKGGDANLFMMYHEAYKSIKDACQTS